MSDSTATAEEVRYRFVGSDGCERCQALDGTVWTEVPPPPHPYCKCDVETIEATDGQRACGDNRWSIQYEETEAYGLDSFKWKFTVRIECWDGAETEYEAEVDYGSNSSWPDSDDIFDIWEDYAWNELYDEAEGVAAQFCHPCEQPLVA